MRLILMTLVVLTSYQVFAQSSSTKLDSSSSMNTVPAVDQSTIELDRILGDKKIEDPNVITDQKLKADEGSRSRYSMKFNLSYAGPGITDLGNKDQPNPDHVLNTLQTKLNGLIGGRYRIDGVSAINAGTGVTAIHPLNGWDRTDVSTPFLSYDRSVRVYDVQMRHTFEIADVTTPEYIATGEFASTYYDLDLVKQIGMSRFSAGLEFKFDYFFYGRNYDATAKSDAGAARYYASFYPNLKFKVNDNLNINSYLNIMYYNQRALSDKSVLARRTVAQRLGIGYSFAKDIYLNPYITWFPDSVSSDTTTFNLSAVFSIL